MLLAVHGGVVCCRQRLPLVTEWEASILQCDPKGSFRGGNQSPDEYVCNLSGREANDFVKVGRQNQEDTGRENKSYQVIWIQF